MNILKKFVNSRKAETDGKGKKRKKSWLLAMCMLASFTLSGCGLYDIADLFSSLGKGSAQLYVNEELQMPVDGETTILAEASEDESGETAGIANSAEEQSSTILPGAAWLDTDGNTIQAHGGRIQFMPVPDENGGKTEKYVWVGEDKSSGHLGNDVAVYTSDDLYHWEFQGDVLRAVESREQLEEDSYFQELYQDYSQEELNEVYSCINKNTVIERPKMLYNEKTDKYVIWFHSDDSTEKNSYKYDVGMAGVAISDSPAGPFRFLGRYRLSQCPKDQIDCFPSSKGEARDMNLFKDDDGTAYIAYTSENNKTMYISKLNEDYTYLSADPEEAVYKEDFIRLFPGSMREAPVLFKGDNGRYYFMSSSTTGWMSNQARLWSADEIFGEWKNNGNPCVGKDGDITFDTQSTCVFQTKSGQWIYFGDRWNSTDLADSRYIWLPLTFDGDRVQIQWESEFILK